MAAMGHGTGKVLPRMAPGGYPADSTYPLGFYPPPTALASTSSAGGGHSMSQSQYLYNSQYKSIFPNNNYACEPAPEMNTTWAEGYRTLGNKKSLDETLVRHGYDQEVSYNEADKNAHGSAGQFNTREVQSQIDVSPHGYADLLAPSCRHHSNKCSAGNGSNKKGLHGSASNSGTGGYSESSIRNSGNGKYASEYHYMYSSPMAKNGCNAQHHHHHHHHRGPPQPSFFQQNTSIPADLMAGPSSGRSNSTSGSGSRHSKLPNRSFLGGNLNKKPSYRKSGDPDFGKYFLFCFNCICNIVLFLKPSSCFLE